MTAAVAEDQPADELAARRTTHPIDVKPPHWMAGHAGRLTPAALPARRLTNAERDELADLAIGQWLGDLERGGQPRRRHGRAEDPGADDARGRTRAERASLVNAANRCNVAALAAAKLRLQMLANAKGGEIGTVNTSALVTAMTDVGAWREVRVGVIAEARMHKPDCRDKVGRLLTAAEMDLCKWRHRHCDQRGTIARWLAPLGLALGDLGLTLQPDADAGLVATNLVYDANHDAAQLDELAVHLVRLGAMLSAAAAPPAARRGRKRRWPTRDLLALAKAAEITWRKLAEKIADRVWSDELRDLLVVDTGKIYGASGSREWRINVLERHFTNVRPSR